MESLKFVNLVTKEVKEETLMHFSIACDDNYMALMGSYNEILTFELIFETRTSDAFPYSFIYLEIPTQYPLIKIVEKFTVNRIYENSTVLETQQLSLDPIYVAGFPVDPPKPIIISTGWASRNRHKKSMPPVVAVLTNYGACHVFTKSAGPCLHWTKILFNLELFLQNDVFNEQLLAAPTTNKDFTTFKNFIDLFWITAFAWDARNERLIYVATAAGYVIAIEMNEDFDELKLHFACHTGIKDINYIKSFDNFLLVGHIVGTIYIYKISNNNEKNVSIEKIDCLWSKSDSMSCQKAEITFDKKSNSYFILLTKAAHILAYRLTKDGVSISNQTLYLSGTKITGLCMLSSNEFIATTIKGKVHHLRLSVGFAANEFEIDEQLISLDFDIENMQILGLGTTKNRAIWSLLFYPIKNNDCKSNLFGCETAFLHLCKLNTRDAFNDFMNLNVDVMDQCLDLAVLCRLELLNSNDLHKYEEYIRCTTIRLPNHLSEVFLKQLQKKLLLLRVAFWQKSNHNIFIRETMNDEIEFLKDAIQIIHIVFRLQFLKYNYELNKLSKFLIKAAHCMDATLKMLLENLLLKTTTTKITNSIESDGHVIQPNHLIENFCNLALNVEILDVLLLPTYDEKCLQCDSAINAQTLICYNEHENRRCSVSCVQLQFSNRAVCSLCRQPVLDYYHCLQQLYNFDWKIKCIYCRTYFVMDTDF